MRRVFNPCSGVAYVARSGRWSTSPMCQNEDPEVWRKKYQQGYFVLRKFFYNSPEMHDHEKLEEAEEHEERKTMVFAQFSTCIASWKPASIAVVACESSHLLKLRRKRFAFVIFKQYVH